MKKGIKVLLTALLVVILALTPLMASALKVDEEQELDIETGEPIKDKKEKNKNVTTIANGITYNKSKKLYYYTVGDNEVGMNYPDGVITTKSIRVVIPSGMGAQLFINGAEVLNPDFESITEPGSYVVMFRDRDETTLRFTIVNSVTGAINEYRMPTGFTITSVKRDKEELKTDGYRQSLTEEGKYEIEYKCKETNVTYTLNVQIDHTAPTLALKAVNEEGFANGPVSFEDQEKDTTLTVLLNGEKIKPINKELTKSGTYDLTLSDQAGNVTTYHFIIKVYFNFNSIALILIIVALIAALIVYIVRSRKSLRVR